MEYPYAETGARILQLRKERALTREQLAERADISVQFLADIEKGKKNMSVTTLRKLALALQISTDYIVNGTGEPQEEEWKTMYHSVSGKNRAYVLQILRLLIQIMTK